MKNVYLLTTFILILSSIQCRKEHSSDKTSFEKKIINQEPENNKISKPVITYHLMALNSKSVSWLGSIISDDSMKVLLALNRVDKEYLLRLDTLVVPDTFVKDLKIYSPFPDSIHELSVINKIIFFSNCIQAFGAYQNGVLVRWGPVSMGKKTTPTPLGLFHTNWKSKQTISTINEDWIMKWYFNLDNFRGVSMHQYDLPGYPASHACIRMLADDAYWLYNWAEEWILKNDYQISAYGTPVIIFGAYPFSKRKPWKALAENNKALFITDTSMFTEVRDFQPSILEQQMQRISLTDSLK